MKKLREEMFLEGKIDSISMMELRESPGDIIDQAMLGKVIIIERFGRPAAMLTRLPKIGEPSPVLGIRVGSNGDNCGYYIQK